jgi:hypothetical protein
LTVPPILLEDDSLPARLAARFAPAPAPITVAPDAEPPPPPATAVAEPAMEDPAPCPPAEPTAPSLPPHYGTRQLSLLARDPFTLFADWDFSPAEIIAAQRAAARGQVVLRIVRGASAGPLVLELPVEAERRQEFIPAPVSGQAYHAALGFVGRDDVWHELARSGVAEVPPEEAPEPAVAALPAPVARIEIAAPVASAPREDAAAPAWVRAALWSEPTVRWETSPPTTAWAAPVVAAVWTPALAGASEQLAGPGGPGPQGAASPTGHPTNPSSLEAGLSSEAAVPSAPEAGRGFWFKVNAEVVIYGSTERDAKVTIDGRPVQLRPDGSFSFRFSLPDGAFNLPIRAVAAHGLDGREAVFHLTKATVREGEVGEHPQNPALRPPLAEHAVSQ